MSSPQMPPWLQEQIGRLQQSQQNLQSIMTQRQHLEMEKAETEKAIDELKKVADGDSVFKQAGTVLIKSNKKTLLDEFFSSSHSEISLVFFISKNCLARIALQI